MSQIAVRQRFVVGFLFNKSLEKVLLQKKINGPEGIAGKINGHGGKIKPGETPEEAMSRETLEETGVKVDPSAWLMFNHFTRIDGNEVYCFMAIMPIGERWYQIEKEPLAEYEVEEVIKSHFKDPSLKNPFVYNLVYLLPMAQLFLVHPQFRYS